MLLALRVSLINSNQISQYLLHQFAKSCKITIHILERRGRVHALLYTCSVSFFFQVTYITVVHWRDSRIVVFIQDDVKKLVSEKLALDALQFNRVFSLKIVYLIVSVHTFFVTQVLRGTQLLYITRPPMLGTMFKASIQ